jgi:AcrR family transcriptional regulator
MPSHQKKSVSSSSRARLLAAAKRLFAAQGYEQSATSAIAREAGTSESQLMRYFGGKAGLLEALFDDAWEQLNARVARTISAKTHRHDALIAAFEVVVSGLARDSDLATLFLFEGRRLRGDKPRVSLSRGSRRFIETIRGLVKGAQSTRDLDPRLDAGAVTASLLGATEAMMRERLMASTAGRRAFAQREIRVTLERILKGFGTAKSRS